MTHSYVHVHVYGITYSALYKRTKKYNIKRALFQRTCTQGSPQENFKAHAVGGRSLLPHQSFWLTHQKNRGMGGCYVYAGKGLGRLYMYMYNVVYVHVHISWSRSLHVQCISYLVCTFSVSAKPLGLVVATSEDTLKSIRPQIERYTQDDDDDGQRQLAKNWRFLDGKGEGEGRGERERERGGGGRERERERGRGEGRGGGEREGEGGKERGERERVRERGRGEGKGGGGGRIVDIYLLAQSKF